MHVDKVKQKKLLRDNAKEPIHVAIIGGGLTGLSAAKRFIDEKNTNYILDIYEDSYSWGGKVESRDFEGVIINPGPEFIDTSHDELMDICISLGIPLTEATEQKTRKFTLPSGKTMGAQEFFNSCLPIYEIIRRDKAKIRSAPQGELVEKLNRMSLSQYMQRIEKRLKKGGHLTKDGHLKKTGITQSDDPPVQELLSTIAGAYAADNGRSAEDTSALQYVHEASSKLHTLVVSDCGYRIQGGTEEIIKVLKRYLEAAGKDKVTFHEEETVRKVNKREDGKIELTLNEEQEPVVFDQAVFGLTMPALGKIEGLDSIGLSTEDIKFLGEGQYTYVTKFTAKTTDAFSITEQDKTDPDKLGYKNHVLYSHEGFEAWRSAPNMVTFLVSDKNLTTMSAPELVTHCLKSYTKAIHPELQTEEELEGKAQELFEERYSINKAIEEKPCHAAPAPGQFVQFIELGRKAKKIAEDGSVGIAGTWMPFGRRGSKQIGFMEGGIRSAQRATEKLISYQEKLINKIRRSKPSADTALSIA